MFFYLLFLFTVVPIVELYLLIRVGQYLGALTTVMIVIFTGMVGAYLARMEGLRVLLGVQRDMQEGRMPAEKLLDGFLILIGGILLITPGILTDIVGFLLVIPASRALIKVWVRRRIQTIIQNQSGVIEVNQYYTEDDNKGP